MNLPVSVLRIVIVRDVVDFRKGFNGLLSLAYRLGFDPYKGDCLIFVRRNGSQVRALLGDKRGLFLVSRRFDGGRLGAAWRPSAGGGLSEISLAELGMIFDGSHFRVIRRIPKWK